MSQRHKIIGIGNFVIRPSFLVEVLVPYQPRSGRIMFEIEKIRKDMCRVVCNPLTIVLISMQVYNSLAFNQTETSTSPNKEVRFCRFKDKLMSYDEFKNNTKFMCFYYLFRKKEKGQSCTVLSRQECERWKTCSLDAVKCCDRMLKMSADDDNSTNSSSLSCHSNWDGYGCWDKSFANKTANIKCPGFASTHYLPDNLLVTKDCSVNGTWELHPITKRPWTDYTVCFLNKLEDVKTIVLVNIFMNAASILFLGPAIIIFLAYKFLRREMIIMIHISFFTSLFLASVMLFLINTIFTYQNLTNPKRSSSTKDNFECVSLNILHRYFDSATYFWMFCEASHLHQLTVNCFRPPRRMYMYHCFAWGLPLALMIIYIILRVKSLHTEIDDDPRVNCWIPRAGQLEWIFNVPHIICSILNVVFLCHILRQLFKLESHPNDPSSLRRSVKALILLLPLFGIQILIVTYRVPESSRHYFWVNIISDTITGTKGLIVSVLFCYMNGEVLHYLRRTGLTCLPETRPDTRKNSCPTINSERRMFFYDLLAQETSNLYHCLNKS
ncbi:calcitonin gene-related peptide type 1 receptor-like [Octopus vulgaris]|uniref:Calcitonin gene-related peptide type 1 receptor-like n=1 Tax=Octopus vulgaris TaxID=6645 RepID=A0AA36F762_OCTVU|nr:calcitonin gene-related peptide type 1 receptor-like [Octopus vulgaris]